jgi:hypothetical protein
MVVQRVGPITVNPWGRNGVAGIAGEGVPGIELSAYAVSSDLESDSGVGWSAPPLRCQPGGMLEGRLGASIRAAGSAPLAGISPSRIRRRRPQVC